MLYYTQLIFIKEGREELFHTFEDNVLPLLAQYNGSLVYRVRPASSDVVATTLGYPYELHLVSFATKEDFTAYANSEARRQFMAMKDDSVERVILLEGIEL